MVSELGLPATGFEVGQVGVGLHAAGASEPALDRGGNVSGSSVDAAPFDPTEPRLALTRASRSAAQVFLAPALRRAGCSARVVGVLKGAPVSGADEDDGLVLGAWDGFQAAPSLVRVQTTQGCA